jgi:hypothetical protein
MRHTISNFSKATSVSKTFKHQMNDWEIKKICPKITVYSVQRFQEKKMLN